jgi:hypothetical protein
MSHKFKTTNIKGKEYVQVNERILYFRSEYPDWSIQTEIVNIDEDQVLVKAYVYDEDMELRFTGHAHEEKQSSYINKTSYVENCETSAVGRALGMMGIGIETSIATAEEVKQAINTQSSAKPKLTPDRPQWDKVVSKLKAGEVDLEKVQEHYFIAQRYVEELAIEAEL